MAIPLYAGTVGDDTVRRFGTTRVPRTSIGKRCRFFAQIGEAKVDMKRVNSTSLILLVQSAVLALALLTVGCGVHPDEKAAVYAALNKSNLRSVEIKEDRRSGVLTLTGIVTTPILKSEAETIAQQAAPGYRIADQIQVKPLGA